MKTCPECTACLTDIYKDLKPERKSGWLQAKKKKSKQKNGIKASTGARINTMRLSLPALIPRSDAEHCAQQDKTDRPRI